MPALMACEIKSIYQKLYHELPICHKCEELSTIGTWVSVLAYLKKTSSCLDVILLVSLRETKISNLLDRTAQQRDRP